MSVTREVDNRPHRDAWRLQIDDNLRQARIAISGRSGCAHQSDHIVRMQCVRGPDFLAVDEPACFCALRLGAYTRKVRARAWLAHTDAEERLTPADCRDIFGLLRLIAEIQD